MRSGSEEGAWLAAQIAKRTSATEKLSPELRRDAMTYARRRVAAHATRASIARELGVSEMTIARWLSLPARKVATAKKLRPVHVVDAAAPSSTIVVTTAAGHRVEGLALDDVVALLRALG